MRSSALLLLVGCGHAAQPAPAPAPTPAPVAAPPVPFLFEWAGAPGEANPQISDDRFVLFREDEWGRVLPCPQALAPEQPAAADRHRCAYPVSAALVVGGRTLWAAMAEYRHEFDGMYGSEEGVLLVDASAPTRPVATLSQWVLEVVDASSSLRQRRQVTADLDGDGRTELCIESIDEVGIGLFDLMDLRDQGRMWVPTEHTRSIVAMGYDGEKLFRVPTLDGRCPRTGYASFVTSPRSNDPGDPFGERRQIQEGETR